MNARSLASASLTAAFIAFVTVLLYLTPGLSRVSRVVPLAVLIPTLVLLLVQLVLDLGVAARLEAGAEAPTSYGVAWVRQRLREALGRRTSDGSSVRRALSALGVVALLPAMIVVAGFAIAVPSFAVVYLRRHCAESWKVTLTVAAVASLLLVLVDRLGTGVVLYRGIVPSWLFG